MVLIYRIFLISDYIFFFFSSKQGGNLPIHWAARNGYVEVIRVLLECDPSTASVKDGVS